MIILWYQSASQRLWRQIVLEEFYWYSDFAQGVYCPSGVSNVFIAEFDLITLKPQALISLGLSSLIYNMGMTISLWPSGSCSLNEIIWSLILISQFGSDKHSVYYSIPWCMETPPHRILCENVHPRLLCLHAERWDMLFLFLCITSLLNRCVFLWLDIQGTIFIGYKLREENIISLLNGLWIFL